MHVGVVSADRGLYGLCREILSNLLGCDWALKPSDSPDKLPKADLYVWDYSPGMVLPDDIDSTKNIILVSRSDLEALRDKFGLTNATILLKPVTRAALQTFLEQACNRWGKSTESSVEQLQSDRDELLQCLIEANLKLQEYDQQRTNFLARAVHDFRAPLTAISGYCGLMLSGQLGAFSRDQEEVIRRMHYSAKRLSRMASAMFELSICHQVDMRPRLDYHNIEECINQALYEMLPSIQDKEIQYTVDIKEPPVPLAFERSQIEQLLINLLDNAAKFTPSAGWIKIQGYPFFWERRYNSPAEMEWSSVERRQLERTTPNSYRIDIADSGPSIPADRIDKIFEEYISYGGGVDRSGAGLGLAVCRMIVTAHGGRLWAESTGEGVRFSFVLPLDRSDGSIEDKGVRAKTQSRRPTVNAS